VVGPWFGGGPSVSGGGVQFGMIDDLGVVDGTVVDVVNVVDGGDGGGDCDVHDADKFAAPARTAMTTSVLCITAAGIAEPVDIRLNLRSVQRLAIVFYRGQPVRTRNPVLEFSARSLGAVAGDT
jgi:hypothetical protein